MVTVPAVYENGVLRPTQPLNLREGQEVSITVTVLTEEEIARRLRAAKTYQEWFAATKLLPATADGFDVVKAMNQSRRETGFRQPAPDYRDEEPK